MRIDGSEAGGQFLRSALALSAVTGEPIHIKNVRGSRSPPGLRPQHLTTIRLLTKICDAEISDISEETRKISFNPDTPTGGEYAANIETAGSITLVFDAILPLALEIDSPLTVTINGGTDVKWAPPIDYFQQIKLPLLRRFGLVGAVDNIHRGYYPKGSGQATLQLAPSSLTPINIPQRGEFTGARVFSGASMDLSDQTVSERQADTATEELAGLDIAIIERTASYHETVSPGSTLTIQLNYANTTTGFDALGEPGKPAESVAESAFQSTQQFIDGAATVDRHMADQLLIFIALAGGRVIIPAKTSHVTTSLELLSAFGYDLTLETYDPDGFLITNE